MRAGRHRAGGPQTGELCVGQGAADRVIEGDVDKRLGDTWTDDIAGPDLDAGTGWAGSAKSRSTSHSNRARRLQVRTVPKPFRSSSATAFLPAPRPLEPLDLRPLILNWRKGNVIMEVTNVKKQHTADEFRAALQPVPVLDGSGAKPPGSPNSHGKDKDRRHTLPDH